METSGKGARKLWKTIKTVDLLRLIYSPKSSIVCLRTGGTNKPRVCLCLCFVWWGRKKERNERVIEDKIHWTVLNTSQLISVNLLGSWQAGWSTKLWIKERMDMASFFLINLFIFYLFIFGRVVFFCCVRAFSSCGEQGLLFVVMHRLLTVVASLVAEHRL